VSALLLGGTALWSADRADCADQGGGGSLGRGSRLA